MTMRPSNKQNLQPLLQNLKRAPNATPHLITRKVLALTYFFEK